VSAENHFTLSAKEFLWNASNEKAYLFIVVNKFDQIKNKEKCRRLVLDQIRQLSPRTHDDAQDLVHFVDSATALQPFTANPSFDDLESALRSFVLAKRSKSKLLPVATYLKNVLSDVEFLSSANSIVADTEIQKALADLEQSRPVLEKMKASRDVLEQALETIEDEGVAQVSNSTKTIIVDALDRISQGLLAIPNAPVSLPTYPGILNIWDYAKDVRRAMLISLDAAIKSAEDEARVATARGVDKVKVIGEVHLPSNVERSRRVFMPEAMFSVNRRGTRGPHNRRRGGAIVAGGTQGLGIGLANRQDLLETSLFDLFDFNQQFLIYIAPELAKQHSLLDNDDDELFSNAGNEEASKSRTTALSVLGIGLSALTMVGSQIIGARGIVQGILSIGEVLENESSRKWLGPVLGVVTLGFGVYVVYELPSSVPKTIGRRVRKQVLKSYREQALAIEQRRRRSGSAQDLVNTIATFNNSSSSVTTTIPSFVDSQAERVGKETRKVLRLASWDLRERFKGAMEDRDREVKGSEELEEKARKAKEWFESVVKRTGGIREEVGLEELASA
jgi:mitofusin